MDESVVERTMRDERWDEEICVVGWGNELRWQKQEGNVGSPCNYVDYGLEGLCLGDNSASMSN